MMELTMDDAVYQFNFGMGFLREINKTLSTPIVGTQEKRYIGLQYAVGNLLDGDTEALVKVLDMANMGLVPRVKHSQLEAYVEDEGTDIDALFDEVLDFLKCANATKKTVLRVLKELENLEKNAAVPQ